MALVTFSDENMAGDIPQFEISKELLLSEYESNVDVLLESRNGKVVVVFQSWATDNYQYEVQEVFVSSDEIAIQDFYTELVRLIADKDIDLNFFCFDTWEEAFKYCIDLKEGL